MRIERLTAIWTPAAILKLNNRLWSLVTQLAGQLSYVINQEMYGRCRRRRRRRRRRPHLGGTNCN